MVAEMTPREFVAQREQGADLLLLDVREDWELAISKLADAMHIPMGDVPARLDELDPERGIVVMCRSGGRSAQVARFLQQHGYRRVWNLTGGILAWGQALDPSLTPY